MESGEVMAVKPDCDVVGCQLKVGSNGFLCELHQEIHDLKKENDRLKEIVEGDTVYVKQDSLLECQAELTRLKSWEHFEKTYRVMLTFSGLSQDDQERILLMTDGLIYRQQKKNEEKKPWE